MASVFVELHKQLTSELKLALPDRDIKRRYMPLLSQADLETVKISVYQESYDRQEIGRSIDADIYSFGIAVQKAAEGGAAIDGAGNPVLAGIDNLEDGDAVMDLAEQIKDLWRSNGALRDKHLAGCRFVEFTHDPPYEPLHLLTMGVYSSIIDVSYQLASD